jgi:ribosome-associated protein
MQAEELKSLVIEALEDRKGHAISVLDVRASASFTDFMVVATGTSNRQVKALADHVVYEAKHHGVMPLGVEGEREGEWALVDLGDVVVHVMQPQVRDFYNLEKLWAPMDADARSASA